ncbi:MAG: hypothetical protein HKN61_00285 [Flavobacteriaceae bacterium]|nr:hypothetical protein [Flavobacteriaceae bacterium]
MLPFLIYLWIIFSLQLQQPTRLVAELPSEVKETSGLAFYDGKLYTHNDSGRDARIYELDTDTGAVIRSVALRNAENRDWEDMDQDESHIYVADIGNTFGDREDLVIYKITKSDVEVQAEVTAERIEYIYEDREGIKRVGRSEWDAEALLVMGDQLVVFSKSWQSETTRAYAIPKSPGKHIARHVGTFTVNGLITGATYNAESGFIYLSGYSRLLQPFVVSVSGMTAENIFAGEVRKKGLDINFSQVEAITAAGPYMYYLSSENFTAFDANLYTIDTTGNSAGSN